MAGAEPVPGDVGGSGSTLPGRSHGAVRLAPLDPEQLRRVLEQVTRAQPPPSVLPDAAPRLRDGAQQAAQQRGPGAAAPRLLTPQELEAICIKVSGDTRLKERTMPPMATIQPKTVKQSQLLGRRSSMDLCVSSPQLLRVQALGRTESQLHVLRGSRQPPAPQMFVQKMLLDLHPVPLKRVKTRETVNGHGITLSPGSSGSAQLLVSSVHTARTEKSKKSLSVRTRSGRVSRPPRYKARDYKFIKTEDLAEGHLSDSDDYSELSVEEEEEPREKPAFFDFEVSALKPKAFKCQTCEKSYIGKGGLVRHCKLNPGHSQLQPEILLSEKANGSLTLGFSDSKTRGLASPKPSTPATLSVEEAESAWPTLQALKQCGREELVELVLPQLAQAVTLYELLLVKATVKKPRTMALPTHVLEYLPSANGCQQKPRPSRAPAFSKGSDPAAIENSLCSEGSCREMVPASDGNVPPVGQRLALMASDDFEAGSGSADPTLLCQDVSGSAALYSQAAEPRGMPLAQESVFSEENIPEHSIDQDSGAIWKSNSVCGTPSSGRRTESLLLRESENAEAGDLRETNQPHLSGLQASPSHVLLAESAAFPLHNILPVNILPAARVSKTVPEPVLHPDPGGSLSTNGGPSVGSEAGDISQLLSRMETHDQRAPETAAAVGEALAFDISNVCQEVLSQGQEQIFIRTSNGFILSYPSTIVSQEDNNVIVTNARGSILRFGQPEGVALEAMEAFLTVEAEYSQ
ncbi:zinc finger protein 839 isoform X7 [Arvicanthis niloticus]|uniref:zinc finger protein 839 isoform X7 n=1 Tax=Arvicanthis niloticus TaxID=61156 RepID=UPI00402BBC34